MRTTFFALVLAGFFSLFGGALFVSTQDTEKPLPDNEAVAKAVGDQLERTLTKVMMRMQMRMMLWDNSMLYYEMYGGIIHTDGDEWVRELGVTEEQRLLLTEIYDNSVENLNCVVAPVDDLIEMFIKPVQDSGTVPEGIESEFTTIVETRLSQFFSQFEEFNKKVEEVFTPEQKQTIREFFIVALSDQEVELEYPLYNMHLFEAFDLTGEQRAQFEEIKKELEPEFEQLLDQMIDQILQDEEEAVESGDLPEDIAKASEEAEERFLKLVKEFHDRIKVRTLDVLTDEQFAKYIRLINDPPEHINRMLLAIRKVSDEPANEQDKIDEQKKPDVYIPGPNSWKPGDPIPEGYLQQRQERTGNFPRSESK
jgi:uncharacterized protein YeaC (DUF1315 family)